MTRYAYTKGIVPKVVKQMLDEAVNEARLGLDYASNATMLRFNNVTRQWKTKVNWQRKVTLVDRKSITVQIMAVGDEKAVNIWTYVDEGTEPHVIRPKTPGGRLFFRTGYQPKTLPIAQYGGSGRYTGGTVSANEVNHPGTEAREFSKVYALFLHKLAREEITRRLKRI